MTLLPIRHPYPNIQPVKNIDKKYHHDKINNMAKHRLHTLVALQMLASAACGVQFAPYERLDKLRVLAIAADPPQINDAAGVQLDALVVDPAFRASPRTLTYLWSWCPFTKATVEGSECNTTEADIEADLGIDVPSLEIGTTPQVSFTMPIPEANLAIWCQATSGENLPTFATPFECRSGRFPLKIQLEVESEDGERIVSTYTLWAMTDSAQNPVNGRPNIGNLTFQPLEDNDDANPLADPVAVSGGTITRQNDQRFQVTVDEADAETLDAEEADRIGNTREELVISWFYEQGSWENSDPRTYLRSDIASFEEFTQKRWTPPSVEDFPGTSMQFVVVIRDGRGGVNWASSVATLTEDPL